MKLVSFFESVYASVGVFIKTTQWLRVAKLTLCTLIALLAVFYGAAMLFKGEGGFTIAVLSKPDEDDAKISLSETADFTDPTVVLSATAIEEMTNISVNWLPDGLDSVDGSHNGDHYIAYTFYLKNAGDAKCNVEETFLVEASVKGAEEAIRVRLYKNGEMTTYAKMGANGQPENGTIPFQDSSVVFHNVNEGLEAGQTIKYTLVIWLEGDDPECLDNIKGGNVRMSMTFSAEAFRNEGA